MDTPDAPEEMLLHAQKPDPCQHTSKLLLHVHMLIMCHTSQMQTNFLNIADVDKLQFRRHGQSEGMVNGHMRRLWGGACECGTQEAMCKRMEERCSACSQGRAMQRTCC